MFRLSALFALLGATSAAAAVSMGAGGGDVRANSPVGRALLKSATVIEEARILENNNNNWNYNYNQQGQNEDGERDGSFVASYYIKYLGCSSTLSYAGDENGNDGNPLYTTNLVKFSLCPDSCSSCSGGGLYVVGMQEFVQAYSEMKMDEKEYKCELQAQQCQYNQNCQYDDQYCEQLCFKEAGMEECIEYEGEEAFELDRYLECGEVEMNNNNNNGNNNNNNNGNNNNQYNQNNYNDAAYWYEYFMAPYCASDGKSIKLRLYYDDGCTIPAENSESVFYKRTGMTMPYSDEPIIPHNECMTCQDQEQMREYEQEQMQNQYNNNGNNNNNYNQNQQNQYNNGNFYYDVEPSELCQNSYERAVRCESGMNIAYPDESGCDFIKTYLPKMDGASRSFSSSISSSGGPAKAFAWIFGITTVLFGAYAYFLYRKIKRGAVNLSSQDGAMA